MMKRMLLVGTSYPGLRSVSWSNVSTNMILDYQILLLDCNGEGFKSDHTVLRACLETFVKHGHIIVVFLPRTKKELNIEFLPYGVFIVIPQQPGHTINVHGNVQLHVQYADLLNGEYRLTFLQSNAKIAGTSHTVTNNIGKLICGIAGQLHIFHPPPKGKEQVAVGLCVQAFKPQFEEPTPDPFPEWAEPYLVRIPGVQGAQDNLSSIAERIRQAEEERASTEKTRDELHSWAGLLWLKDTPLQRKINDALRLLDLDVHSPEADESEHKEDGVIEYGEQSILIEATGSDNAIDIKKGRQLGQWVTGYEKGNATGVLIGNAFCKNPPDERPPTKDHNIFTTKLVAYAEKWGLALVDTRDIFDLVCRKLGGEEISSDDIAKKLLGKGVVKLS